MLDKSKLIVQLYKVADSLFVDTGSAYRDVYSMWCAISQDSLFQSRAYAVTNSSMPIPYWDGNLDDRYTISTEKQIYVAISIDGSQIYPDRHAIASCFLINIGSIVLPYVDNGRAELASEPYVFVGVDNSGLACTIDTVNCKRQELELTAGIEVALKMREKYTAPLVVLFDGSLIFWHLSSKERDIKEYFLSSYLSLLGTLYQQQIVTAWYISSPKSKELMNLVRLHMCNFDLSQKERYESIEHMLDMHCMEQFLEPYTRSIVFKNNSDISQYYPSEIQPYFFYVHTGNEIGRVEIPAWIARDISLVDFVAYTIFDQCIKGGGYPIAIAEAHEQAVVKGPDRDFFYHLLQKMVIERKRKVSISRKSIKKALVAL